jgi:arylsulfatase A-like enzyme
MMALTFGALATAGCGPGSEDGRVAIDLVERFETAEVLRSQRFVDMGDAVDPSALVTGWGDSESPAGPARGFTWATAERAVIETGLIGLDEGVLSFRCRPFTWDGAPEQRMEVAVNGRRIGEVVLEAGFADYTLELPPDVTVPGLNRVELSFALTARPSDHDPESIDQRDLAAAFQWMRFGPGHSQTATTGPPERRGDSIVLPAGAGLRYRVKAPADAVLEMNVDANPPSGSAPSLLVSVSHAADPGAPRTTALLGDAENGRFRLEIDSRRGEPVDLVLAATGASGDAGELVLGSPRILGGPTEGDVGPSVLLIVIDTLRADYLGCYGADVRTPVVDGLAAGGVRFSQARSHIPITGPSHGSLFTSLLPMEHGVVNNAQELDPTLPVLAESLGAGGRRTAAVISLGVLKGRFGFQRGFDHYGDEFPRDWLKDAAEVTDEALAIADDLMGAPWFFFVHYSDPHEPYAPTGADYPEFELRLNGEPVGIIDAGGRGFRFDLELPAGDSVLDFIPADAGDPGRTYRVDNLLVNDPTVEVEPVEGWNVIHRRNDRFTYESSMPASVRLRHPGTSTLQTKVFVSCKKLLKKREIRRAYAAETEFVDAQIGRLLDGLEARGMMQDTLIVVASDHGEGLGDHNHVGHISQVYDSLLHVPLIFNWPGRLSSGETIDRPVGLIDVFPTVAELVGAELPTRVTGASLVPLMTGADVPAGAFIAATYRPESFSDKRAILLDGFKYIHSWTDDAEKEELFEMTDDPGELHNLLDTEPETAERLRLELARRLAAMEQTASTEAELSEEDRAHLRALGYIH